MNLVGKHTELTSKLGKTVECLDSVRRKMELLNVSVLQNREYLNPFDIEVYRGIVGEINKDLNDLDIVSNSIRILIEGCEEILDIAERKHKDDCCCIIGESKEKCKDMQQLIDRMTFQLEGLITTRGVTKFNVEALGTVGHASLEALKQLKRKYKLDVVIYAPNRKKQKPWIFDYLKDFEVQDNKDFKDILEVAKFCIVWNKNNNEIQCIETKKDCNCGGYLI